MRELKSYFDTTLYKNICAALPSFSENYAPQKIPLSLPNTFVLLLMIDLRFWGIKCISVVAIRKCTWDCMNQSRSYSIDGNENVISFNCINRYARDPPCHENDRCEMCTASSARLKSHLLFLLLLSSCWRCEMLVVSSSTILDWMSSHQGQLLLSLMTLIIRSSGRLQGKIMTVFNSHVSYNNSNQQHLRWPPSSAVVAFGVITRDQQEISKIYCWGILYQRIG